MCVKERERGGGIKVSILYMYMCPSRQSDLIILNGLTLNHRALKHTRTHTITHAHRKGERNPLEWPSRGNMGIRHMQRGRQRGWTHTYWGWKRKIRKKEEKTPAEAERNKRTGEWRVAFFPLTLQPLRILFFFFPIKALISSTASPPTKTPHGTVLLSSTSLLPLSLPHSYTIWFLSLSPHCLPPFVLPCLISMLPSRFFLSGILQVQPTVLLCIPPFHIPPSVYLSSVSSLRYSFVYRHLEAVWPQLN